MNIYWSEDEQVQKIKEWLQEYGIAIILGIIVFFVANFGWRYWQQYQNDRTAQASIIYERLIGSHIARNYDEVELYAKHLREDYVSTPYAGLASLVAARDATVREDSSTAEKELQWIIEKGRDNNVKQIARIRLARIFLEEKKSEKALEVLNKIDSTIYLSMICEIKGDVYLSVGNKKLALQEYKNAAEAVQENSITKAIIEMKINQLLN